MRLSLFRLSAWVFVSYLAAAVVQTWPLALHLSTALTGDPRGDTGVYVWNLWAFRHELIDAGTNPLHTNLILPLAGGADLSLHNYTVASDLLALPFLPVLGVVAAFNVVYLVNIALAGLGAFLLARHVMGQRDGVPAEAWLAGLLFACSPFLTTRGMGHFSLATAAPLPFFALFADRAWHGHRTRDALLAGACAAWAAFSDPYFAIYCVLLAAAMAARDLRVRRTTDRPPLNAIARVAIDVVLGLLLLLVIVRAVFGVTSIDAGPIAVSVRSLYTPVLAGTLLAAVRAWTWYRPRFEWRPSLDLRTGVRLLGATALAGAVLIAPLLYALVARAANGTFSTPPVFWRSSAPGVDLLSFVVPNPNHPLAPAALARWFADQPAHFYESVASIPLVVLVVLVVARRRIGACTFWIATAAGFAWLSLGPFVRVAGIETYVPTPWTLLRYVPLVDEARMPTRMAVMVVMAISVAFAGALRILADRVPGRRRALLAGTGAVLAFELIAAPRPLYPADVPHIYDVVAADARPVSLMELPFGVRDGLWSIGDFTPASQFYQTRHGKPILGGYISRVAPRTRDIYTASPLMRALMTLGAGGTLSDEDRQAATDSAAETSRTVNLGYVVIDRQRTPDALRNFAIDALCLRTVATEGRYELLRVDRSVDGEGAADGAAHDADGVEK